MVGGSQRAEPVEDKGAAGQGVWEGCDHREGRGQRGRGAERALFKKRQECFLGECSEFTDLVFEENLVIPIFM